MARPDEQIVAAVLTGDQRAFRELVDRYRDRVIASAHHLVGNLDAAHDLAQEAFVDAYVQLESLHQPQRFRQWLYGILRHKCLSRLRARGENMVSWEQDVDEERVWLPGPEANLNGEVVEALNRLPLKPRELLSARYLQRLSYSEMAEMLDTTVNNVRVQCCRAKQALRALLAERQARAEGRKVAC
ncbi:MAG: RNA polymerase sigma factor [Armatimonadota bacterium]